MIPSGAMAVACLAIFSGALVQGVIGFGMGLFSAPVILHVLPPELMPPVNVGLALFMNLSLFLKLRNNADRSIILPLLLGSALGIWPGTYLPRVIPAHVFKAGVGVFAAVAGAVLWRGWKCPVSGFVPRMAVGFGSGLLSGSISLGAPPVAIFLAAGDVPKHVFRSSTATFFLVQNAMSSVAFGLRGAYTPEYFRLFAVLLPCCIGGTLLGARLAGHVNDRLFRRGVMALIIASGLSLLF